MRMLALSTVFVFALSTCSACFGFLVEDFEDGTVSYTTSVAEFSDGTGDFFGRVDSDGISVASFYDLFDSGGPQRTAGFFAAMDTNGDGGPTSLTLDWDDIDIAGLTGLSFSAEFAEDDDGSAQDWDANTSVQVAVDIDNSGSFTTVFAVESSGGTNTEPAVDTNLDGTGDGTAITDSFETFTAAISGSGATLDLRITLVNLESGDEDIAFDNISINGTAAVPEPSAFLFGGLVCSMLGVNFLRRRRNEA